MPADLLECMWTESPGKKSADMFRTQINLYRNRLPKRKSFIVNSPELMADETPVLLHHKTYMLLRLVRHKGLDAIRTQYMLIDTIPMPGAILALLAWKRDSRA